MQDAPSQDAGPAHADGLLEQTWSGRDRAVRGRELRLELVITAVFLAALAALAALAPPVGGVHPLAGVVVVAYALAARATFPLGAGNVLPTQLFLIPLFALAPAQLVPALVFAGLALSTILAAATGRKRLDRLVHCGGDALHAVGPALVLVLLAGGDFAVAGPAVLLLALAA